MANIKWTWIDLLAGAVLAACLWAVIFGVSVACVAVGGSVAMCGM